MIFLLGYNNLSLIGLPIGNLFELKDIEIKIGMQLLITLFKQKQSIVAINLLYCYTYNHHHHIQSSYISSLIPLLQKGSCVLLRVRIINM